MSFLFCIMWSKKYASLCILNLQSKIGNSLQGLKVQWQILYMIHSFFAWLKVFHPFEQGNARISYHSLAMNYLKMGCIAQKNRIIIVVCSEAQVWRIFMLHMGHTWVATDLYFRILFFFSSAKGQQHCSTAGQITKYQFNLNFLPSSSWFPCQSPFFKGN